MLVQELISQEIPPLKLTDSVAKALDWMDQFKVSHLAVTDGRKLLGLISENDLLDSPDAEILLSEHKTHLLQCFVFDHQHA
ncbi:MAG: CBS domain-containing protein, partial [Bacteroidia bacterium]